MAQRNATRVTTASISKISARRWIKWTVLTVVVLVLVTASALLIAFYSIDWSKRTSLLVNEVKEATGRELKIKGDVKLGLFPPRLIVGDVSLANAPWGTRPYMFAARHIDVSVSYAGLFRGRIDIDLAVAGSELSFEEDSKGNSNWDFRRTRPTASTAAQQTTPLPFRISRLDLRQVVITTRIKKRKKTYRFVFDELGLTADAWPIVQLKVIADVSGSAVQLTGTIQDIDAMLGGKAFTAVEFAGDVAGARLRVAGRVKDLLYKRIIDATLAVQSDDLPEFGRLLGMNLPTISPAKLESVVQESNNQFKFSKFHLTVGNSSLLADWTLDLKPEVPRIRGIVRNTMIDAPQLANADGKKAGAANGSPIHQVFPNMPWPTDALHALDLNVQAEVSQLRATPKATIRDIRVTLRLANGHLSIDPLMLPAVGGTLDLRASLDAPVGKPAQLTISAKGGNLDLGKTLNAFGVKDLVIGGPTQLAIDLKGVGATPAAVADSLDGHIHIVVGPGRVKNSTLLSVLGGVFQTALKAINPFQEHSPYSELQCLVVNVPVHEGVVRVEHNMAFETDQVGVSSAGAVNLGKEEVDLAIKPKAKAVLDVGLSDLAGMVRIRGPWSDVKIEVDPEGTARSVAMLWIDIATGGATWLADRLIFTPFVLDAPCKAALKEDQAKSANTPTPVSPEQRPAD